MTEREYAVIVTAEIRRTINVTAKDEDEAFWKAINAAPEPYVNGWEPTDVYEAEVAR